MLASVILRKLSGVSSTIELATSKLLIKYNKQLEFALRNKSNVSVDVDKVKLRLENLKLFAGRVSLLTSNISVDDALDQVCDVELQKQLREIIFPGDKVVAKQTNLGRDAARMPYRVYKSVDGINIRVGRSSLDNDKLSIMPKYRTDTYWWLHIANCAGSHVVICSDENNLPKQYPETLLDAALLCVNNSMLTAKNKDINVVADVHYTRCNNIYKNTNDPPGLVRLGGGHVGILSMNRYKHRERENRLNNAMYPLNYNDLI